MGRDTTERARVLAELRSSEARKTAVLESSMDALVTIDEHGTVVEFNPAAERVFGYSRAEAMGRLLADLIIPPALREAHRAGLARYLETGEGPLLGLRLDLTAVRSDGSELPVEVTITKVDLPGRPLFTGSLRDMTEERRTEAERANLTSRLHQADRLDSLGQLAGGVAHDFNNLLAVILNHASLVDREVTDDRTRKDVAAISEAAQRAAGLTRQLLAFSRAEPITDVVVDVDTVAQPVSELLRRTLPENITLLTRFAPDAWHVRGDPTRIEQLVMNLAINARDAMPDGGRLTIETANEHLDELSAASSVNLRPGRYVRLSVSDSGTGMSREVREHAFEPFYSTKPKGRGTGLGLATVYGIMRQLGGAASIYSELGRGTTVMLHLPAADEPAQGYVAPPVPRPRASGGDRHVLLLEDEDLLREAIGRVLRNAGYTVTALATGEEALAAFDGGGGQALDLVVSDVTLPGVSGPEVVNRLRAHRPEVPALFMSGYTENALAGQEPGRLHLLEKPFTLDALLARAEELLGVAEETGR